MDRELSGTIAGSMAAAESKESGTKDLPHTLGYCVLIHHLGNMERQEQGGLQP